MNKRDRIKKIYDGKPPFTREQLMDAGNEWRSKLTREAVKIAITGALNLLYALKGSQMPINIALPLSNAMKLIEEAKANFDIIEDSKT